MDDNYPVHPPQARWTHVALRVTDIAVSIDWYARHTPLKLLDKRQDDHGFAAWLGHDDSPDKPFILVLAQFLPDSDPFKGAPIATLAPFAHLGIEVPSRNELESAARRADDDGCLVTPPTDMPPPIGYICMIRDPDGNMIEISHDQGVYAHAQKVMR
ncbi:MAG: VOC family protein [Acidimicrobiaceae bacterium]|nr:VOC family protein [Acidimicrobiaceae bacterium]MCY4175783.1 VOC family protein [Acidimicrobiaceae bacterium]MCY4280845.1 VOC family protein [Acidimicrobiaceae bacterium]MCY4293857.1 VOC family protein [Acidimicrobiaceae bacterium]